MNLKADAYFNKAKRWREEMKKLRTIVLNFDFAEELKWGKPCYTFQDSNVVLIMGFKHHCVLLVCKGVLLKDPHRLMVKPGENTQSARQIRFTNIEDIIKNEANLKAIIRQAIAAEKAGLQVKYKNPAEVAIPQELEAKFKALPALKTAFTTLTPGRRRAYIIYISAAKQSKTRQSRIEKYLPQILRGKGMND